MAEDKKPNEPRTEPRPIRLVENQTPPEEVFVDGVAGGMARAGVMKLDWYRVLRVDPEDNAEIRSVTHRLVLPAAAVPELGRLFQNMAGGGRRPADDAAGAEDPVEGAQSKTK